MDSLWLKRGDDITEIRATFFTDCRVILPQIRGRNFWETYIKSRPNTHSRLFEYCSLCLLFRCNGKRWSDVGHVVGIGDCPVVPS